MKKVKVSTKELLDRVRENRASHADAYEKALAVYREEATARLKEMYDAASSGSTIVRHLDLVEPEEHLEAYDQVIDMLQMCLDEEVELESAEFAKYVRDNWSWQEQFRASTVSYAAKFKG
jgi:hypothetical protein